VNAFVTYEQEDDGVAIHRVYVGEGKTKELLKKFYKEIGEKFGPQPQLRYVDDPSGPATAHGNVTVKSVSMVDPESEQVLLNWRATVHAAKNPHKFGDWLVEKHGWIECEDVQQDSL
jgi:hypothetical protein